MAKQRREDRDVDDDRLNKRVAPSPLIVARRAAAHAHSAAAFRSAMNRRRQRELCQLNQAFAAAVASRALPAAPAAGIDQPFDMLDDMNEYLRLSALIERKFGIAPYQVVVMGSNESNQLGLESRADSAGGNVGIPPTLISRLRSDIRMVQAGGVHSVALSTSGVPYSWGSDDEGTLGRESAEGTNTQAITPSKIVDFVRFDGVREDGRIVQIAAGDSTTLFLSLSGNVYQCGIYSALDIRNFSDIDGANGSPLGCNEKPVHVFQMPGKVLSIHSKGSVNAAIMEDFSVVTWGTYPRSLGAYIGVQWI